MPQVPTIDDNVEAIHAAHSPDMTAGERLNEAKRVDEQLDKFAAALAAGTLAAAASALTAAGEDISDPFGKGMLASTANFLKSIGGLVTSGQRPREAISRAAAAAPTFDVTAGVTALRNASGQLQLQGSAKGKAAIPLLGGMLNLALNVAAPKRAVGSLELSIPTRQLTALTLPKGTIAKRGDGREYRTLTEATIKQGQVRITVKAEAVSEGAGGNTPVKTVTTIVPPVNWPPTLELTVTNPRAFAGGKDAVDWGLGVSLPLASGLTFQGGLNGDLTALRGVKMLMQLSSRQQQKREGTR
jgi:hypothetical protein